MYQAVQVSESDLTSWDEMIRSCPHSCAFHTLAWKEALEKSFKQLKARYFIIKDGSDTVAAFPIFTFSPLPLVKVAASMPWNLFGGALILRKCEVSEVAKACAEATSDLADELGVCESDITLSPFQDSKFGKSLLSLGYRHTTQRYTHLLKIQTDYDEIWKRYNKRIRGAVRKSEKLGVKVRESKDEADLRAFYKIYLESISRLDGTPKPFSLLRELQKSHVAKLSVAEYEGEVIAGLLYLFFNRTLTLWAGASAISHRDVRPNNAIFHRVIKWACQIGYDYVDFGASPPGNRGLVAFKEEWRAEPRHFDSYVKIHSKWRRQIWSKAEPLLRKAYGTYQRTKG